MRCVTKPLDQSEIIDVYTLIKKVFRDSPLFLLDTVEDFYGYEGVLAFDSTQSTLIGGLLFTIVDSFCYIEYLGTTVKGCGVGTELLKGFLQMMDNRGLTPYLHVERTNNSQFNTLISWYQKHGFKLHELKNVYPYYQNQVDAVMMVKW